MVVDGDGAVGRAHDAVAGQDLLYPVGAPAGDTSRGEQRREDLLRDAEHMVHKAGVHIDVRADGVVAPALFLQKLRADRLDLLQQLKIVVSEIVRNILSVFEPAISVPRPTWIPASRYLRIGAATPFAFMLLCGQCATQSFFLLDINSNSSGVG